MAKVRKSSIDAALSRMVAYLKKDAASEDTREFGYLANLEREEAHKLIDAYYSQNRA